MVPILINKDMFEPSYNDLKLIVLTHISVYPKLTDGQQAHNKMLSITNYKKCKTLEVPPHTSQNGQSSPPHR